MNFLFVYQTQPELSEQAKLYFKGKTEDQLVQVKVTAVTGKLCQLCQV